MIQWDTQFVKDAGEFYVPETKRWFTFCPTTDPWALKHDLIHGIDTTAGARYGIVCKGVAYVCTDENEHGCPVLERWSITKRNVFTHN